MKINVSSWDGNIFVKFVERTNKPYFVFGGPGYDEAGFHLPVEAAKELAEEILIAVGDKRQHQIDFLTKQLSRIKEVMEKV